MNADEYIKQRLQDQIEWYSRKSQSSQRWFKRLRIIEIFFAACIPFCSGFMTPETINLRIAVGFMGLLITVIAGVLSIFKFQENWIDYRTTSEVLKHEHYLFLTGTSPYNAPESFPLLVSRVESLISKENTNWNQYVKTAVEKNNP